MAYPKEYFLITADVSEGVIGGDRSVADVWDCRTWEQIAQWYGYIDPNRFAKMLYDLGVYYGWCMICVETNYPGNATHGKLLELEYPKIWMGTDGKYWQTTQNRRHVILSDLREALYDGSIKINSQHTLTELRTFIRTHSGKVEAQDNCNDDCVMSAAMAAHILKDVDTNEYAQELKRNPLRPKVISRYGYKKVSSSRGEVV